MFPVSATGRIHVSAGVDAGMKMILVTRSRGSFFPAASPEYLELKLAHGARRARNWDRVPAFAETRMIVTARLYWQLGCS